MICDRLRGSHLARMAQLRINQLPETAEELREQPEAISSFTSLVNALCRLSERALKNQQYLDSRELAKPGRSNQNKGLPGKLVGRMHEQLNLL